jgi:hypothetical protein
MPVRRSRTVFRYHVAIRVMAVLASLVVPDARAQTTTPAHDQGYRILPVEHGAHCLLPVESGSDGEMVSEPFAPID